MGKIGDYQEILVEEGYRPALDEDGDIRFKHQGTTFYLQARDDDDTYMRLLLAYQLSDDITEEAALAAANANNIGFKAIKTSLRIAVRFAEFSLEGFYTDAVQFTPHLGRSITAMEAAAAEFFKRARETTT